MRKQHGDTVSQVRQGTDPICFLFESPYFGEDHST